MLQVDFFLLLFSIILFHNFWRNLEELERQFEDSKEPDELNDTANTTQVKHKATVGILYQTKIEKVMHTGSVHLYEVYGYTYWLVNK